MSDPVEMDLKPRNVASEYLKALARIEELEEENERLRVKIKGPSSWPCGICGTPKVLDCPVCGKARIEAALALHQEFRVYGECECEGPDEDGTHEGSLVDCDGLYGCAKSYLYSVCSVCHTSNGEMTEDSPDEQAWPCPTVAALAGEGGEEP